MILCAECGHDFTVLQRNAFWHGPRFEHIADFQSEVVMQMAGGVLLHHEPAATTLRATPRDCDRGGFGRARKVSFCAVIAKRLWGFCYRRRRSARREFARQRLFEFEHRSE